MIEMNRGKLFLCLAALSAFAAPCRAEDKPAPAAAPETVPAPPGVIVDAEAVEFAKKIVDALPKKGAAPDAAMFDGYRKLFKDAKAGPEISEILRVYDSEKMRAAINAGTAQFKSLMPQARKDNVFLMKLEAAFGENARAAISELVVELQRSGGSIVIVGDKKADRKVLQGFKRMSTPAPAAGALRFPADRSLGKLKHYDFASSTWKEIGEAKGDVAAPKDVALTLALSQEGAVDLSPLAKLPPDSLATILFDGLEVKGDQLAHLKPLTGLKKLSFRDSKIADADLEPLKDIPSIQELDLGITPIGDEGIKHLKSLPNLQTLDISYTKATNASVDVLKEMTGLTYLDPQRTEIKGEKLDELIEALPNCSVVVR